MSDQETQWHAVIQASKLEEEEPEHARIGEVDICVVRLPDGIYAINDICTHEFAQLSEGFVEDGEVECPLHQARFEIKTGKCTALPAETDVAAYPVKVEDDTVYVGLPAT